MDDLPSLESRSLYTVGWLTALPSELAAAAEMLDEEHGRPLDFEQAPTDKNVYTWGRIKQHNIVVASLSAGVYGTTSATSTAMSMLASFPSIKVGLMVGIGAGVPDQTSGPDVRLGDVVVSQPHGLSGGVVQYDVRKATTGGSYQRVGSLASPPELLLKALANLQARHMRRPSQIPQYLKTMNSFMTTEGPIEESFIHQGVENDRFFVSTYEHQGGNNCELCDTGNTVRREPRASTHPRIHYGVIASGNELIKSSVRRDELRSWIGEKVICFEMEAAGLMNHFPCLVIRGICDYADSHKNDRWQRYAAATAAAYTKELLSAIPPQDVEKAQTAKEVMGKGGSSNIYK